MDSNQRSARVTGHLVLRKNARGPAWYAKTRVPGRQPEQTMRRISAAHLAGGKPPPGALTKRQALDELADILAQERQKVGQRAYQHGPATFADAAAGYLHHVEHVKGREESTVRDYRGSIDTYLNPRWKDRPVDSITPDEVEQLREDLRKLGRSPRTIVRHLTVAHGVFKFAMRKHGLARNPASAELVDRPEVIYTGEFQMLDWEQLAALMRHAETKQDAVLYLAGATTGLRQGELRALQIADIDFTNEKIHLRRSARRGRNAQTKPPKSRKVRSVPLVPQLAVALARLLDRDEFTADDDLVFPTTIGEIENEDQIRRRYYRALKAAKLPQIRFHDLRHVFGSTAVQEFPLSDVQAFMGHAHIATTMRYVHHRPGKDDAARLAGVFPDTLAPYPEPYPETGDTEPNSGIRKAPESL